MGSQKNSSGGHNVPLILDDFGIRKLTPRETLLFQGFPEDFNIPEDTALSHLYKQAGNSVPVPVVARIASRLIQVLDSKLDKPLQWKELEEFQYLKAENDAV